MSVANTLPEGLEIREIDDPKYGAEIAELRFSTYQYDTLFSRMYPIYTDPAGTKSWMTTREITIMKMKTTKTAAIFDTTTGMMLAFIKLTVPVELPLEGSAAENLPAYPEGFNVPLQNKFRSLLKASDKYYNKQADSCKLFGHRADDNKAGICADMDGAYE
ncbi:hypothetical protein N7470_005849 [Penicillium chermesinum]|nr:hypothetical protein N7470_005849 [Penicillium chermesinum]